MPELTKKQNALIIALIAVFYVAFRVWGMTDSCPWFDEIFSVHAAEHPWETIISFVAKDLIHPPLFYVSLKIWITLGGEGVFWLRLLPVIFSVIALLPFWMLCRELKLRTSTSIVALSLFAVNGSLIKYAQEVRMYSLLLCLSLFSTWLFSRFYFRGKDFWLLTAVNILLVYTHYFGWLVVIAEVVAILIGQRIKILRTLLMFGVAVAAFLPWIYAVFRFAEPGPGVEQNIGWIARPGLAGITEFAFDVIEPFYYQQSSTDPTSTFLISVPLLLLIAAAKIIYFINFKDAEEQDAVYLMTIFTLVPLTIAFIASWLLPVSVWGSRHLIIVFAPMMLIIAVFISSISIKPLRYALIGTVYLLIVIAFVLQMRAEKPQFIWCAWEKLADEWIFMPHYSAAPKTIYVFEDLIAYHFWFATRSNRNVRIVKVYGLSGMTEDSAYFLPRGFDKVNKVDFYSIDQDEIWVAFREPSRPETVGIPFIGQRFEMPVTSFENRGYIIENGRKQVVGPQTAYIINMRKGPVESSQ